MEVFNLYKKIKRLSLFIVCIMLSVGIYMYIGMVVTPKNIEDSGGQLYYSGMGFLAEPENTLDVMVYGNSDVYSGFSPAVLFEKYGITAYSSGRPRQTINNINRLLGQTLKKQQPKLAILETDCFYSKSTVEMDSTNILFAPFIYHSRWKEIKTRDFHDFPSRKEDVDLNKGYIPSKVVYKTKYEKDYMGNPKSDPKPFPKENEKHIRSFIEKCKKENIEILLLELPSPSSWSYAKHNAVKELAKQYDVKFVDMNIPRDDFKVELKSDFRDNGNHMNTYGAARSTEFIGQYIQDNYSHIITNKKGDKKYEAWNNVVDHYHRTKL